MRDFIDEALPGAADLPEGGYQFLRKTPGKPVERGKLRIWGSGVDTAKQ